MLKIKFYFFCALAMFYSHAFALSGITRIASTSIFDLGDGVFRGDLLEMPLSISSAQKSTAELGQIRSVAFIGKRHAWFVTLGGALWHTQDGGAEWRELTKSQTRNFSCVSFVDHRYGWAVSHDGFVLRTINGGKSWNIRAKMNYPVSGVGAEQTFFIDKLHGWIIGGIHYVWRTTDGGATWELLTNWKDGICSVRRIKFFDSKNGFLTCYYNSIFRTFDGGKNWKLTKIAEGGGVVNDIYFSGRKGWIAGSKSVYIHHTINNGKNWTPQSKNGIAASIDNIESLSFIDSIKGWATGEKYLSIGGGSPKGVILQTDNGGHRWHVANAPTNMTTGYWIFFADRSRGWVIDKYSVYRTTNAGRNWKETWNALNR
jgi:photosystem II stability/assembly factor-like uncharacterized protein